MSAGEFQLIDRFLACFPRPDLVLGPGDDCALLRVPAGRDLAVTTDAVVEGVHFSGAFSPADIGHKALAVNLSDLAAMGATPLAFQCALAFPPARAGDLVGIGRGMARLAKLHNIAISGGNMTRASELSITVTAMGTVKRGRALTRAGARPGDTLYVSGALGGAAAGLLPGARPSLVRQQRRPDPCVPLGEALVGIASACIDVSDGLAQDLGHLLEASGVGAWLDAVPVQKGATLEQALTGGEDYELLFAVPPARVGALQAATRGYAHKPIAVGRVVKGQGLQNPPPGLKKRGHDHFSS
jgi:thiamine-monophosphate kinase